MRIDYTNAAPGAPPAMLGLENYVRGSGLEHSLLEMVKTRASQIIGCADCLDMHTKDALAAGGTEQRLYGLAAWREAPSCSERERAALAWTAAVTLLSTQEISDELYAEARRLLAEQALADLTLAISAINGWNRLAVAFRSQVGSYQAGAHAEK